MLAEAKYTSCLKKETLLKESPIFQNTVVVDWLCTEDSGLFALHFHEFIEISLVLSGNGYHRIWNETTECTKGDMYILNAGVPHSYFAKSPEEMPTVCNLLFDAADFFEGETADPSSSEYCYGIFSENTAYAYLPLKSRQMSILMNLYQMIQNELSEKNSQWLRVLQSYLTIDLITVKRFQQENKEICPEGKSKDKAVVASIVRYVMEHYADNNMTLAAIAQSLYMSKSYLSRIFRSVTGEYFSDYVKNVRLKQACRLLEETQLTNEQIVYCCGLKDIPSFYKLFKAQYMQTPSEYRASNNKLSQHIGYMDGS